MPQREDTRLFHVLHPLEIKVFECSTRPISILVQAAYITKVQVLNISSRQSTKSFQMMHTSIKRKSKSFMEI